MLDHDSRLQMLQNSSSFQGCSDGQIRPIEPTLADILAAIEGDTSVPKAAREGWRCSIRRVANYLGRDPAQLPARLGALRFGITRLHHAQLGISRKTLQNHIANLKAAIRHVSDLEALSGRGVTLAPAWQAL